MISLGLFLLSVAAYSVSQHAQHSGDTSGNKYKQPLELATGWYSKLFSLKYKERYPLSGSFLVFATDRYHFFQMIFKLFLCASVPLYEPIFKQWYLDAGLYFLSFGTVFTLVYRVIK